MNWRDKVTQQKLPDFDKKPDGISDYMWNAARDYAVVSQDKLKKETADPCFYYFMLGEELEEISSKFNLPAGILSFTAIVDGWPKRRDAILTAVPGSKAQKAENAAVDLITDSIIATTAIFRQQLEDVIKDPSKFKECALIPRNLKELKNLIEMLDTLSPDKDKGGNKGGTNIYLNNMIRANQNNPDLLSAHDAEFASTDRVQALKALKGVELKNDE